MMKTRSLIMAIAAFVVVGVVAISPLAQVTTPAGADSYTTSPSITAGYVANIIQRANLERAAKGLPPLTQDTTSMYSGSAQAEAQSLAQSQSVYGLGPGGGTGVISLCSGMTNIPVGTICESSLTYDVIANTSWPDGSDAVDSQIMSDPVYADEVLNPAAQTISIGVAEGQPTWIPTSSPGISQAIPNNNLYVTEWFGIPYQPTEPGQSIAQYYAHVSSEMSYQAALNAIGPHAVVAGTGTGDPWYEAGQRIDAQGDITPTGGQYAPAPLNGTVVGMASTPDGSGYWLVNSLGGVSPHGDAQDYGGMEGTALNSPITHIVSSTDGKGYWLVAADGGVFSFGDAPFYGSMGGKHLNAPVVDIAPTNDGKGYWLVASDGGIFSFGDAQFHGSMGDTRLNQPVVGIAGDPATGGYWEVASDGGIFSFDAPFYGSTGSIHLNEPILSMAPTADGHGYWFVASDGGIFAFGDGGFYGSEGAAHLNDPITGMAADDATGGYWMVGTDGGVFSFGSPFFGAN